MNQQKELFFTEMNLFKNELLTSLKPNNKSHSQETSNDTDRIISLLQDQIEFLQEQLKSKDKIINSLIENLSRNDDVYFFSQKAATLKASENQTNYEQLQNTKTIDARKAKLKTLQNASAIKRKKAKRINKKIHLRRSTRTWQS